MPATLQSHPSAQKPERQLNRRAAGHRLAACRTLFLRYAALQAASHRRLLLLLACCCTLQARDRCLRGCLARWLPHRRVLQLLCAKHKAICR